MGHPLGILSRLGVLFVLAITLSAGSPPISVSIQATWQEPPILIQILESVALERPALFFPTLDTVCSAWQSSTSPLSTDQQVYESLIRLLRSPGLLDGPGEIESLEFSLALKEAQPKIEAFRAWYASLPQTFSDTIPHSNHERANVDDCSSWTLINDSPICLVSQLSERLDSPQTFKENSSPPQILPFDHRLDQASESPSALNVILYSSPDPASFCPSHQLLRKASEKPSSKVIYTFRWKISSASSNPQSCSSLSGWGASLDIKKSEYLTLDDRPVEPTSSTNEAQIAMNGEQQGTEKPVDSEQAKLKPLKAAEIFDIGAKATQHVLSSGTPLSTLRQLAENFPLYAHTLVNEWVPGKISEELARELEQNLADTGSAGETVVWMNGLPLSSLVSLENLNFFKLIEIMRAERGWMASLAALGLSPSQARTLIMDEKLNEAMNPEGTKKVMDMHMDSSSLGERFDASDRQEGGGAIVWLNDLETDEKYSSWPATLRAILRPTFPGQLHAIARNLINVVLGLDLTRTHNLRTLGNVIHTFVLRLPIRWGIVPILSRDSTDHELMSRCFWNLTESIGPIETLSFIKEFTQDLESESIDVARFIAEANDRMPAAEKSPEELQVEDEKFEKWFKNSQLYASRLSLCSSDDSIPACMLINGRFFVMDEDFRSNLQETAMMQTAFIQHQVYFNLLQDGTNVADYLYDLPLVHRARNDLVFPSEARPLRFFNLNDALHDSHAFAANKLFHVAGTPSDKSETRPLASIWIVGNLDSDPGTAAVAAALGLLIKLPVDVDVQVSFVHTPSDDDPTTSTEISASLAKLVLTSSGEKATCQDLIDQLRRRGHHITPPDEESEVLSSSHLILTATQAHKSTMSAAKEDVWSGAREFANAVGAKSDGLVILINGRMLSVSATTKLVSTDLIMLVEYETQQRIGPLIGALQKLDSFDMAKQHSDLPLIMSVLGVVLVGTNDGSSQASSSESRSSAYRSRLGDHSSYQHGDESKALFDFGVILNPASEAAQRWSALLERLSHRSDVRIKVWFNPSLELSELPIKRFFRTAISNSLEFDTNGRAISARVEFRGIPTETLFTLAIDAPPAWLALPHDSIHDLDNIRLSDLPAAYNSQGVEAIFKLEHIILGGHAREVPNDAPPRGLQIVLRDLLRNQEVDTIIMANLGYFQFKSAPGLHRLSIRPGRSLELYQLESIDLIKLNDSDTLQSQQQISLTTFNGLTIFPRFRKRPDKLLDSLIQPVGTTSKPVKTGATAELNKLITQVKDLANGVLRNSKKSDLATATSEPVINVFTVASGLLYERMAYLMCVSVMRHTRSPVKFWFISNFLSPSFKRFIPHLAREYGFDYQLVTYRWPSWLRAQKEKQRVIWGYKILFLDVLFPLEVDRVIFVDSDQIVRTDLKALVDLDLMGAPYAYAPMCNDRNETKGFRFWDTGYWKESLQGRPYHISALYVVDLRVFRAVAAGDQLRQHYQALSADPGSLANLDQDLPNNMQNMLPIFTLDQSWLWCETWCSDDGLKTAKTIDLCNNPLTHEPKLKRARRLIPEWDVYDQEVAGLAERIKKANHEDGMTIQAGEKIEDDEQLPVPSPPPDQTQDGSDSSIDGNPSDQDHKVSRDEL